MFGEIDFAEKGDAEIRSDATADSRQNRTIIITSDKKKKEKEGERERERETRGVEDSVEPTEV